MKDFYTKAYSMKCQKLTLPFPLEVDLQLKRSAQDESLGSANEGIPEVDEEAVASLDEDVAAGLDEGNLA